jgi:hypothetical protein
MFHRQGPERMRRSWVKLLILAVLLGLAGWWLTSRRPTPLEPTANAKRTESAVVTGPATPVEPGESASAPASASADAAKVAAAPAVDAVDPLLQTDIAPGEALRMLQWCGELAWSDPTASIEQQGQWLGKDVAALERTRYVAARKWAIERCGDWALVPESDRAVALRTQLVERARQSTDLSDRLRALSSMRGAIEIDAAQAVAIRQLLEQALLAGRPELLGDIGRVLGASEVARADLLGPYAGGAAISLFSLLGCDLGAPCGADSEALRRNCALRGFCGYPDYETMLFDAYHGARAREVIQRHRAELLRRIRAGQIAGLFDPVPLPPNPL